MSSSVYLFAGLVSAEGRHHVATTRRRPASGPAAVAKELALDSSENIDRCCGFVPVLCAESSFELEVSG